MSDVHDGDMLAMQSDSGGDPKGVGGEAVDVGLERVSWVWVGLDDHLLHDVRDVLAAEETGGAVGAAKGADRILGLNAQDVGTA